MERQHSPFNETGHTDEHLKEPGYYWNLSNGEIVTVPKGGAILAGEYENRYLRIPGLLVLVLAPLLGILYILFLPLIAIVAVTVELVKWLMRTLKAGVEDLVLAISSPSWVPGRSYMAGRIQRSKDRVQKYKEENIARLDKVDVGNLIEELEKEIAARRKKEGKEG